MRKLAMQSTFGMDRFRFISAVILIIYLFERGDTQFQSAGPQRGKVDDGRAGMDISSDLDLPEWFPGMWRMNLSQEIFGRAPCNNSGSVTAILIFDEVLTEEDEESDGPEPKPEEGTTAVSKPPKRITQQGGNVEVKRVDNVMNGSNATQRTQRVRRQASPRRRRCICHRRRVRKGNSRVSAVRRKVVYIKRKCCNKNNGGSTPEGGTGDVPGGLPEEVPGDLPSEIPGDGAAEEVPVEGGTATPEGETPEAADKPNMPTIVVPVPNVVVSEYIPPGKITVLVPQVNAPTAPPASAAPPVYTGGSMASASSSAHAVVIPNGSVPPPMLVPGREPQVLPQILPQGTVVFPTGPVYPSAIGK